MCFFSCLSLYLACNKVVVILGTLRSEILLCSHTLQETHFWGKKANWATHCQISNNFEMGLETKCQNLYTGYTIKCKEIE